MKLIALKKRREIERKTKLNNLHSQFGQLLKELQQKNLPDSLVESVNTEINHLNSLDSSVPNFRSSIIKIQTKIIRLVEKETKLVPKSYYRNLWISLGMVAFGLPIGVSIGFALKNMGFLAIGLPIGLILGILVGNYLDKKAVREGRQLEIDIRY